ncbi:MAG: hypothetical protein LRZ84_02455 [Desertifilum sp.]|nr:hypothetical protein [Desertifilum sp.]
MGDFQNGAVVRFTTTSTCDRFRPSSNLCILAKHLQLLPNPSKEYRRTEIPTGLSLI